MPDDTLKIQSAHGFEYSVKLAGLGARSYAYTIDWHIRLVAALAWMAIALLLVFFLQWFEVDSTEYFLFLFLPAGAIYFLYHPILELAMAGNTPGKRYAKVKVLTKDGGIPSSGAILVRNVMRIFDGLPFFYMIGVIACLITRQQVRIGDLAAGTLLVYETTTESAADEAEWQSDSDGITVKQRELIRKLLDRWDELTPEHQTELGTKALKKLDQPINGGDIRETLEAVLK